MTIVTIIVYDRFDNLERWVNCMKGSPYQLVVIHNDNGESRKFAKYCRENNVMYFRRDNIGFDIGSFQDVCSNKIEGFPDWTNMLWCADDTICVKKDFVELFLSKLNGHSTPCMEISREVTPHIRTTGFMISRDMASRIVFPADKVTTKDQCYHFEHRGGRQTFFHQLNRMGKRPVMVSSLPSSPLWDIGNKRHLRMNRWSEFEQNFNGKIISDKVVMICLIYNSYPQIISSLICQTHQNWELILIHDGKNETGLAKIVADTGDKRIKLIETKERKQNWGHYWRQWALNELKEGRLSDADYVVIGNSDNYIPPIALKTMLDGFKANPNAVGVFGAEMSHSYRAWDSQPCRMERGYIDCAGVMLKKDIACEVGWKDIESHSADWFFFQDIINRYGKHNFVKVRGNLLTHN